VKALFLLVLTAEKLSLLKKKQPKRKDFKNLLAKHTVTSGPGGAFQLRFCAPNGSIQEC